MCFEGDFRGVVVSLGSDEKAQDDGWERRGGGDIVSRRGWGDFVVPAGASGSPYPWFHTVGPKFTIAGEAQSA